MDGYLLVVGGAAGSAGEEAVEAARAELAEAGPVDVGAIAAGIDPELVQLRVEVDGVRFGDGEHLLVGVGNGRTVGGGTALFPDADPADGLLEVITAADGGVWDRLRLGFAARTEEHPDLDGVLITRGRQVVVSGSAAWNDDGELGEPEVDRRMAVEPGAWRLLR